MIDEPYGPLLSPTEAEVWLGIPSSTVRTWHERRRVTGLYAEGRDQLGRPRFYLADLLVLQSRPKRRIWGQAGRIHTLAVIVGDPCLTENAGVVERSCDRVA